MTDQVERLPPLETILDLSLATVEPAPAREQAQIIETTLLELGAPVQVRNIHHSPRFTQFSLKLGPEVKLSRVRGAAQDLAVALSGDLVEIQEATPVYPYVRIVVANQTIPTVRLRPLLESSAFARFQGLLKVPLGLDIFGEPAVIDLAAMPHLLIGGATGTGKSVCLNAMVAGLICTHPPRRLQLILMDPLAVELTAFNGVPHLIGPVIVRSKRVLQVLDHVNTEIDRRYRLLAQFRVRDLAAYNRAASQAGQKPLARLVIVIDNLFDLMMRAPQELEQVITRIAQRARAAGIHLVLATVRTNVDTVAGAIKANFPGRIAFKVVSRADSQLILDQRGAEALLGAGDMLYRHPDEPFLKRIQGAYLSDQEAIRLVEWWAGQND